MHEELKNEQMPYIQEVDKFIMELNENERTTIMKKAPKIFEDLVLKQLHEHNYFFLGKHGGKNHHPICSLKRQARL